MSLILGLESSCDETAAAVVQDGNTVLGSEVASQIARHAPHGGVVPELAAREHLKALLPVTESALNKAGVTMKDIDAIAVTQGPGLIPALLVGLNYAKGLAQANGLPLIGVNHFLAHIYGAFLDGGAEMLKKPETYPILALVVSGGHTSLLLVESDGSARQLGCTIDDAAGEALDKAARTMGIPYPGGLNMDKLAKDGDNTAYKFPTPKVEGCPYDFSFSGLKTSVINTIHNAEQKGVEINKSDLGASFMKAVSGCLIKNTEKAMEDTGYTTLVLAGGVSANSVLRADVIELCKKHNWTLYLPELALCGDNAVMVGSQGYYEYLSGNVAGLELNAFAGKSIEE